MQQRELGGDYQKWVSKLLGFSFEVQFKPGVEICVVDVVSRKTGENIEMGALLSVSEFDWTKLDAGWPKIRYYSRLAKIWLHTQRVMWDLG